MEERTETGEVGNVEQRRLGFGRDRQAQRERFEEMATTFKKGEFTVQNEDGSWTNYMSYEHYVDPLDKSAVSWLAEFRLRAAAAGLKEAFAPLMLSAQSMAYSSREAVVADPHSARRGLTFVQLGYETPTPPPADTIAAKP